MDEVHRRSIIDATSTPSATSRRSTPSAHVVDREAPMPQLRQLVEHDTPIELVAKFELVINLNAARVFFGLTIAVALVARADEVIR